MSESLGPSIPLTLGAMLAGGMVATGFSALLGFQTFLYYRIFPSDNIRYKLLVAWVWIMDAVHTVLLASAIWQYIVLNFANIEVIGDIYPVLAVNVAVTATITLSANAFYWWRIHKLSKQNWWLTGPIGLLCLTRFALAYASTIEMFKLKTFAAFQAKFQPMFTAGLISAAVTDIVVSLARYYFLRNIRQGNSITHEAVDAVVVFTVNDGALQSVVIIAACVCFLALPNTFIFLGIFFCISKLASNSMLATLNMRNWYRYRIADPHSLGLQLKKTSHSRPTDRPFGDIKATPSHVQSVDASMSMGKPESEVGNLGKVEVFVEHQVEYVDDFNHPEEDRQESTPIKTLGLAV